MLSQHQKQAAISMVSNSANVSNKGSVSKTASVKSAKPPRRSVGLRPRPRPLATGAPKNGVAKPETDHGRYERDDWTLFRTISSICQFSGVPPERLRRLVANELPANSL